MEIVSKSPEQTKKIARDLAKRLSGEDIVCLFGDLGTGKTVFVQGLAEGLGIKKRVLSPSFLTMREYDKLVHLDFYHQVNESIKGLDLQEIFTSGKIIVIEWADKIKKFLPRQRLDIFFEFLNDDTRRIRIVKQGS
ncbi:tRNA (adenosine(37)-N6)-threonylcarbamoyltransferase complex ATPase subunit type 1 TsaE [Candidatus Curtissbacteria bacterium RBG_16_39_7]|uniref:tRNA threonylcarbamoyladenosine biosynthesis protein TsaE n=1 Tax=Candidatus Curtissbacteria bacterium RBG_16_39_7 TaxID=1797707 RepID=A0A1F5G4F9_9BACT|nr:MAG: tRNA (adenosine(37)-N6)-threonylcarbamoyltransferase complex ATPase subunit type 1 TsaE [Candidatus Curtissbacteria bacterium RBG_16_39_7]